MDEKGLKFNKRVILLRSICLCLALLIVVAFPVSVGALGRNYTGLVTLRTPAADGMTNVTMSFKGDGNALTVKQWGSGQDKPAPVSFSGPSFSLYFNNTAYSSYATRIEYYPLKPYPEGSSYTDRLISLDGIPSGCKLNFEYLFDVYWTESFYSGNVLAATSTYQFAYYDSQGINIGSQSFPFSDNTGLDWVMHIPEGAVAFRPCAITLLRSYNGDVQFGLTLGRAAFGVRQFDITFTVPTASDGNQQIQGSLGDIQGSVDDTNDKLNDTNDKLDGIQGSLDDTNDKLDDMQGSVDKLPGEIGDEMQDVIDKENEKHESEGNKFVDQLLDILPDPSQDVLVALGSLASSTGYTGTDAVLPIPAIVLPGISGLFPETVLWGGGQLDFGEYLEVVPSSLLTLVQSLFTIAIVLFCVFELKGIISYCLTLRSGKGG